MHVQNGIVVGRRNLNEGERERERERDRLADIFTSENGTHRTDRIVFMNKYIYDMTEGERTESL